MPTKTLEERVAMIEADLASVKSQLRADQPTVQPWWKRIVVVYKDDPEFLEAMRLGREYRESLRPLDEPTSR